MTLPVFLLLAAIVIFSCVLLNNVSNRIGIPYLLFFIVLGMVFGADGLVRIEFDNAEVTRDICSAALLVIMFYGGFGTNWKQAKKTALPSAVLASAGVAATALLTGAFGHFVLGFPLLESMILGSAVSSTDAASVFSILRAKRLNLRYNTASILELESGSNDPFSYLLTVCFISLASGTAGGADLIWMLVRQLALGAGFGVLIALVSRQLLCRMRFANEGFGAVFLLGIAVLSYALPEALGGNGYLSAYLAGIAIGNEEFKGKREMVHFFDSLTDMCQMLIFFLLGLLSYPSRLPAVALPAILLSLFMLFAARPLVVMLLGLPFGIRLRQGLTISWAGFRGASSIVFAIYAVTAAQLSFDLYHIVFFIVLLSILVQGSLLPAVARKLDMIDETEDVMKTFSDYSEESPVEFIHVRIPQGHPWDGRPLSDIQFPLGTLAVMLVRGGRRIVPGGATKLQGGDDLILTGPSAGGEETLHITESTVGADSPWLGKPLSEISGEGLLIQIIRDSRTLIPDGSTRLKPGDRLIWHRGK